MEGRALRRLLVLTIATLLFLATGNGFLALSRSLADEDGDGFIPLGQVRYSRRDVTLSNLKTIGQATWIYADDYQGKLPLMPTPEAMRSVLFPTYVKDASCFFDEHGRPLLPNPSLSGKRLSTYGPAAAWTVWFYENHVNRHGYRRVLMLNGNARVVSSNDWLRLRKASGIP